MSQPNTLQTLGHAAKSALPKPEPAIVADTLKLVLASANEWVKVFNEEKAKRGEIRAWEQTQLQILHVQRDFLLTALDKTFDERRDNFQRLFDNPVPRFEESCSRRPGVPPGRQAHRTLRTTVGP